MLQKFYSFGFDLGIYFFIIEKGFKQGEKELMSAGELWKTALLNLTSVTTTNSATLMMRSIFHIFVNLSLAHILYASWVSINCLDKTAIIGMKTIEGELLSHGIRVQRRRLCESVKRVDPVGRRL